MRVTLLLRAGNRDPTARAEALATLDRMGRGGIYDQIGGGFHRYSTDAKWLVPHFEKMLYDNALLAAVYLEAAQTTGRADFRRVATETLDFVLREMTDPAGGFCSTLDADSADGEGSYYLWRPEETIAALGPRDGRLFNRVYGVSPAGNFTDRSIPNLLAKPVEGWAREWTIDPANLRRQVDRMRVALRIARERRPRPSRDDKVLANWNGLMLRSMALGYRVTGGRRFLDAARRNAGFLLASLRPGGELAHSWRAGTAKPGAYLDDYSCLIVGLAALYDADDDPRWIREAQELAAAMDRKFWDGAAGTYVSTDRRPATSAAVSGQILLAESRGAEDGATPSGQAMAALALIRLAQITGNREPRSRARRVLDAYAVGMKRSPAAYATLLLAADLYFKDTPASGLADPVRAELATAPAAVVAGQVATVQLRLTIAPGWHVNAAQANPGYVIPARITIGPGPFRLAAVSYPAAQKVTLHFSREPLMVYERSVLVRVKVSVPAGVRPGRRTIRVRIRYQPCNDRTCLLPAEKTVTVPLTILAPRAWRR